MEIARMKKPRPRSTSFSGSKGEPVTARGGRERGRVDPRFDNNPPLIRRNHMKRIVTTSAVAGAMLFGLGTLAYAVTGAFNNDCTMGLASHKIVHTDCSVNGTYKGQTYCFGNEAAKTAFFKNPSENLAKAEKFYKKHPA